MKYISGKGVSFFLIAVLVLMGLMGVSLYQAILPRQYLPLVLASSETSQKPDPTPVPGSRNYKIPVGRGYTDVSPKQIVRTSTNKLYVAASTCDNYPCTDLSQKLRMYQASSTGIPAGFKHVSATNEPGGVAGLAIAIDGTNRIHVAWTERSSSGSFIHLLRYTSFDTTTNSWSSKIETVDSNLNVSLDGGGQGIQSVALALDAKGVPHVVYLRQASGDSMRRIYYRHRVGGSWAAAVAVDSAGDYGNNQKAWHPNLAFDTAGRVLAVWERGSFNTGNDGTIFGRVRETNGSWGSVVNISGTNAARVTIDQSTSLVITPDNHYHISWLTSTNDYIRYQYSTDRGKTWSFNNPGNGKQITHNPSLGYANGKLRIYGHGVPTDIPDGHGDDLFYFEGSGSSASWGSWTKIVSGAYDSSINTRWSQYFHHFPNTADIAYWADPYPNEVFVGSEVLGP